MSAHRMDTEGSTIATGIGVEGEADRDSRAVKGIGGTSDVGSSLSHPHGLGNHLLGSGKVSRASTMMRKRKTMGKANTKDLEETDKTEIGPIAKSIQARGEEPTPEIPENDTIEVDEKPIINLKPF